MAAKPDFGASNKDLTDSLMSFLGGVARVLFWLGTLSAAFSFGMLVYYIYTFSVGSADAQQAADNLGLFNNLLLLGLLAGGLGAAFLWWGESVMTASLVGVALIVVLVPQYIPPLVGEPRNEIAINCYKVITTAGTVYAVFAALVLLIDIGIRARDRFVVGVKADQIKFGKGMVEEKDKQNVFMGKCWQLPYCRKFVRERCPIYHARRSCWRERVGCMCEEQVIRNAMEGKTIPKNVLAAAAFIPKNHKLTMAQKRNRCRQCVIYNEHQKHKYRLSLFVLNLGYLAFIAVMWGTLLDVAKSLLHRVETGVNSVTLAKTGLQAGLEASSFPFEAILLVAVLLVIFTYLLKTLEVVIFKFKI